MERGQKTGEEIINWKHWKSASSENYIDVTIGGKYMFQNKNQYIFLLALLCHVNKIGQ